MSVEFVAWNPTWARLRDATGGPPKDEAEAQAWVAQGGWAIGIDVTTPHDGGKWPGHLVLSAAGFLVDLAAAQFNRPERGIPFPDCVLAPLPVGFLDRRCQIVMQSESGARAFYTARPDDRSYLAAPGFTRTSHNREATKALLAALEG